MTPTPTTLLRTMRPTFRSPFFTSTISTQKATFASRTAFRAARYKQAFAKRWASTAAGGEAAAQVQQSWVKRMWDSPIGLKTVHFWAPVMKWSLVLAGIADLARPAEKLSLTQNFALTCTGAIWTRWCLIIKPRNILLATVNFFLGCVGIVQVSRILLWRRSPEGKAALAAEAAKENVKDGVESVKEGVKEGVESVKKAVGA